MTLLRLRLHLVILVLLFLSLSLSLFRSLPLSFSVSFLVCLWAFSPFRSFVSLALPLLLFLSVTYALSSSLSFCLSRCLSFSRRFSLYRPLCSACATRAEDSLVGLEKDPARSAPTGLALEDSASSARGNSSRPDVSLARAGPRRCPLSRPKCAEHSRRAATLGSLLCESAPGLSRV